MTNLQWHCAAVSKGTSETLQVSLQSSHDNDDGYLGDDDGMMQVLLIMKIMIVLASMARCLITTLVKQTPRSLLDPAQEWMMD